MTGELTLAGTVEPVGGIREKVLGACRARMAAVVLPAANERVPRRRHLAGAERAASATSERHCRLPPSLMPTAACRAQASPHDWLAERRFALDEGLRRLGRRAAGRCGRPRERRQRAPRREDGNRRAGRRAADLVADTAPGGDGTAIACRPVATAPPSRTTSRRARPVPRSPRRGTRTPHGAVLESAPGRGGRCRAPD